jgi:cyanophycin synthetase
MSDDQLLKVKLDHFFSGAINGATQPSAFVSVECKDNRVPVPDTYSGTLITELASDFSRAALAPGSILSRQQLVIELVRLTREILIHFKHPSYFEPKILAYHEDQHNCRARVQIACLSRDSFLAAIRLAKFSIEHFFATGQVISFANASVKRLVLTIHHAAPLGFNTSFILEEAHQRNIPWIHIAGNIYQLGIGASARLFDSSVSDMTPLIGSNIATNKHFTQRILRRAGFPVVQSAVVQNQDQASTVAARIGFPVVVKPVNTEGGQGVAALLDSPDEVINAFTAAKKFDKRVLVEKHFVGKDFRIHIVNGQIHGIIQRDPAQVIADGQHTVGELIAAENKSRLEATDDRRYLHPITINHEAERLLTKQGLSSSSKPPRGSVVQLRAAANVASGGVPQQLPTTVIHPDNAKLCIDVCRLLRLDIAGVDLIVPNISESWVNTGAHICEINHKPQMFSTFFGQLFDTLFGNHHGRIPLWIIMEPHGDFPISRKVMDLLSSKYKMVCWATKNKRHLHGADVPGSSCVLQTAQHAILDTSVEALIVTVDESTNLSNGWPFTYCDRFLEADESCWPDSGRAQRDKLRNDIELTLQPRRKEIVTTSRNQQ